MARRQRLQLWEVPHGFEHLFHVQIGGGMMSLMAGGSFGLGKRAQLWHVGNVPCKFPQTEQMSMRTLRA